MRTTFEFIDIETAYRKLKRYVYYDKTDLFLRQKLAEFECDPAFDKRLKAIVKVVNNDYPLNDKRFLKWLREISFRVTPKSIESSGCKNCDDQSEKGRFITNVTTDKTYTVGKVNYFFDGPIELHIISVLWIMFEGKLLDAHLVKECSGARLVASLHCPDDSSAGLYRRYHELYAQWRDTGIRKAEQLLTEEQTSVCIVGLDVQEFYYRIRLDFQEVANAIDAATHDEDDASIAGVASPSSLLRCLEAICRIYREKIDPLLQITHKNISDQDTGIPIGLCSSQLLANWYLRGFDRDIISKLRPAYYGRYVDDILIVVTASENPSKDINPVASFMDRVLVKAGLLKAPVDNRYEISNHDGLFLQQEKCILQYFDVKHSIAGLVKFQKKLEENGSNFLLLPVDEADNSLEDIAYELLYEGSVNKFRSVKGMAENRYELAKHMARQTILHTLTDDPPDTKVSLGLRKFFKGKNAIEFHDLWERVFTFFVIAEDQKAAKAFTKQLHFEISRVKHANHQLVTQLLISNLESHLGLCHDMSSALSDSAIQISASGQVTAHYFRDANLVRHHFVRLPLLNYTTHQGIFIARTINRPVKVARFKLKHSPRFINFDECLLLAKNVDVNSKGETAFQRAHKTYKYANCRDANGIECSTIQINKELSYEQIQVGLETPDLHKEIRIALANIPVLQEQIEASYLGTPVLTRQRMKPLTTLLNEISQYRTKNQEKIDLLIFPEVSIPYSWEPMIVAWARKHNIGVICGLEHRVIKKEAFNEVLAALPYKAGNHHLACAPIRRLKRSYSPDEKFILENENLKVPNPTDSYQLIKWRGASFTIYNCYELASIEDRALFKGKVDFIVCTEFNKDVNYFSNIVESASRDIHCYVIQVNDSKFGDSRVVTPSKTEIMNPLRIKGGDNLTFLTMSLDLKALRDHQRKGYGLQKDSQLFKPTPPGLNVEDVMDRIQLGR